ncbi:hypothetical protein HY494_02225 [Candidatus Woesearchaeota archaeon]|nr:hypothetical protein [Candidatus Woesearchaeota archaeon]
MAYTTFSTDNADYVLQLGNHDLENKQVDIFTGIDALVIETGLIPFPQIIKYKHPQLDLPIEYCKSNKTPILGTDTAPTPLGILREDISSSTIGLISLPMLLSALHYSIAEKEVSNNFLKRYAMMEFLYQSPLIEGRNAINARKIEEFVAPLMAERLERKPSLGLIFGAAHMGLKPDLQSKLRRDFTIWNWRNLNFGKWAGFEEEDLNLIQEANYYGKRWEIQTYTPKLFD